MPRSLAIYAASGAIALSLVGVGALPAFADTAAPVAGTQACTDAVDGTSTVTDAKATLDSAKEQQQNITNQLAAAKVAVPFLQATVDFLTSSLNTQTVTVAQAQHAYDRAVAKATRALCTGPAATTTTAPPATTAPPFVPHTSDPAATFADDKDCGDFDSQEAAQVFFLAHRSAAQPDPDRLDANHNGIACEGGSGDSAPRTVTVATTEINNGVVVNPTKDDGSVAVTSGTQVTDVPSGSASTGTA